MAELMRAVAFSGFAALIRALINTSTRGFKAPGNPLAFSLLQGSGCPAMAWRVSGPCVPGEDRGGGGGGERNTCARVDRLTRCSGQVTLPLPQGRFTAVSQRWLKRAARTFHGWSASTQTHQWASTGPAGAEGSRVGGSRRNQAPPRRGAACPSELGRWGGIGLAAGLGGRLLARAGWLAQAGSDRSARAGKGQGRDQFPAALMASNKRRFDPHLQRQTTPLAIKVASQGDGGEAANRYSAPAQARGHGLRFTWGRSPLRSGNAQRSRLIVGLQGEGADSRLDAHPFHQNRGFSYRSCCPGRLMAAPAGMRLDQHRQGSDAVTPRR